MVLSLVSWLPIPEQVQKWVGSTETLANLKSLRFRSLSSLNLTSSSIWWRGVLALQHTIGRIKWNFWKERNKAKPDSQQTAYPRAATFGLPLAHTFDSAVDAWVISSMVFISWNPKPVSFPSPAPRTSFHHFLKGQHFWTWLLYKLYNSAALSSEPLRGGSCSLSRWIPSILESLLSGSLSAFLFFMSHANFRDKSWMAGRSVDRLDVT